MVIWLLIIERILLHRIPLSKDERTLAFAKLYPNKKDIHDCGAAQQNLTVKAYEAPDLTHVQIQIFILAS